VRWSDAIVLGPGVCDGEGPGNVNGLAEIDSASSMTELSEEPGRMGSLKPRVRPVREAVGVGSSGFRAL
jgi:hypothetical protein